MSLGSLFHGFVGRTRIIARCFWAFYDFVLTCFYDCACAYDYACVCGVLVHLYLVLSINFLVVSVICSSLSILKEGLNTT